MRFVRLRSSEQRRAGLEDPMAGVANLFDASLAFIVALLVVLFAASGLLDLLDPDSEFTLLKQNAAG
jgi:hypothetical protein